MNTATDKQNMDNTLLFKELNSQNIQVVSVNQDASMIAAGDLDGNIIFYHNFQSSWRQKAHESKVFTIQIALNNKYLASGSADNTIKFFELQSGCIKNTITLNYHIADVMKVDFSLDSKYLASASSDKSIIIYNINTKQKKTLQFKENISYLQFIQSNKIVKGSNLNSLDFHYFPNLKKFQCQQEYLKCVTFQITQTSLLYLCSQPFSKNILLKNCAKFKLIRKLLNNERVDLLSLCIKNNKAVVTVGTHIEVWDWTIGHLDRVINSNTSCSEITNDGKYLIAISRMNIKVWFLKQLQ